MNVHNDTGGDNSDLRLSIDFGKVGDGGPVFENLLLVSTDAHWYNLRNLMTPFCWGIQIKINGKTTPYEERHIVHSIS